MADCKYEPVVMGECARARINTTVTAEDMEFTGYIHDDAKTDEVWCRICDERIRTLPPSGGAAPPDHKDLAVFVGFHGTCHEAKKREIIGKREAKYAYDFGSRAYRRQALCTTASLFISTGFTVTHGFLCVANSLEGTTLGLMLALVAIGTGIFIEATLALKMICMLPAEPAPEDWLSFYHRRRPFAFFAGFLAVAWFSVSYSNAFCSNRLDLFILDLVASMFLPLAVVADIGSWWRCKLAENYVAKKDY